MSRTVCTVPRILFRSISNWNAFSAATAAFALPPWMLVLIPTGTFSLNLSLLVYPDSFSLPHPPPVHSSPSSPPHDPNPTMATLVWTFVFILLIIELFITMLLVLPFPRRIRRFIARKIFNYNLARRVKFISNFIFLGLVVAISDAINTLVYLDHKEESAEQVNPSRPESQTGYFTSSLNKQRKFRAERNVRPYFASIPQLHPVSSVWRLTHKPNILLALYAPKILIISLSTRRVCFPIAFSSLKSLMFASTCISVQHNTNQSFQLSCITVYLSGFALTLGFVIYRLMDLMNQLVVAEEEKDSLTKRIADIGDVAAKTGSVPTTDISSDPKSGLNLRKRPNGTESTTSTETKKDD